MTVRRSGTWKPHTLLVGIKHGTDTLKKFNTHLTYDPAVPHLGTYSKEIKIFITKNCIQMFIAALLITET